MQQHPGVDLQLRPCTGAMSQPRHKHLSTGGEGWGRRLPRVCWGARPAGHLPGRGLSQEPWSPCLAVARGCAGQTGCCTLTRQGLGSLCRHLSPKQKLQPQACPPPALSAPSFLGGTFSAFPIFFVVLLPYLVRIAPTIADPRELARARLNVLHLHAAFIPLCYTQKQTQTRLSSVLFTLLFS